MRILMIAPPWLTVPPVAYGGIELVVSALTEGLVESGHRVTLVASGGSATQAHLSSVFAEPPFERLGDAEIETIQAASAYQLRSGFDVVHDHTAAVGPALAAVADGPPVIHTLHHAWTENQVRLARLVAPPVRLVAISDDQAARAPRDVPITARVHNGLPLERYPFESEKEPYLLFVGRASPNKGPEVAIEVAQHLNMPLVIAAKINEADECAYWRDVVDPLLAASTTPITLVNNADHEHKVELMKRAAVVVMPIQWPEPFGLVMAEANACGTPVVAYAVGAAPEIIVDGVTGYLVPPGDFDEFCSATLRARALSPSDCRANVAALFSAQRMVREYEAVFAAAISGDEEVHRRRRHLIA